MQFCRRTLAVQGLLLALALPPASAMAQLAEVVIRDYKFAPAELVIKAGTTVQWTNEEKRTSQSILITGPGRFESERLFPGESWRGFFDKPGTYLYTCGPHPEMKGRVQVTE